MRSQKVCRPADPAIKNCIREKTAQKPRITQSTHPDRNPDLANGRESRGASQGFVERERPGQLRLVVADGVAVAIRVPRLREEHFLVV